MSKSNKNVDVRWAVLIVKLPAEPSRYRVAVWRELRRAGATQLGQGSWAFPVTASTAETLDKLFELIRRGDGDVVALDAAPIDDLSRDRLRELHDEARRAEWTEFVSECGKCVAELKREIAKKKFTLAELDEEEQNVERLRRWHRELMVRDLFRAQPPAVMQGHLATCLSELERFTDLVYAALGIS